MAHDQVVLRKRRRIKPKKRIAPARSRAGGEGGGTGGDEPRVTVENGADDAMIRVSCGSVAVDVRRSTGALHDISVGRRSIVIGDIVPWLWRAPTDNDGVAQGWMQYVHGVRQRWLQWGLKRLVPVVDESAGLALVSFEMTPWADVVEPWPSDDTASIRWRTMSGPVPGVELRRRRLFASSEAVADRFGTGDVGTDDEVLMHDSRLVISADGVAGRDLLVVPPAWDDLPRAGLRFEAPADLQHLRWLGMGPTENYPDRRSGSRLGLWHSSVGDQFHPYVVPQEHGAHTSTRWLSLTDEVGWGLSLAVEAWTPDGDGSSWQPSRFGPVVTARGYHDNALTEARTLAQLEGPATTEVHLDAAVRGLGTAACGPDALTEYRLGAGGYLLDWRLRAGIEPQPEVI